MSRYRQAISAQPVIDVQEAPIDGKQYARQDAAWAEIAGGGGGGYIDGRVEFFADLPDAALNDDKVYVVEKPSGFIFINKHKAGLYFSDGVIWVFMPASVQADYVLYNNAGTNLIATDVQAALNELDSLIAQGYKRVDITESLDLTGESVDKTIYAVVLADADVLITLPASVADNEGDTCYIYIEHTVNTNKLIVKASTADTIRGNNTKEFDVQFDGFHIAAHQYAGAHWDVLGWMIDSRTDEIKYIAGSEGVTTINTLQDLLNFSLSSGRVSGGEVTVNVDGTISVAQAEWKLRDGDLANDDCRVYIVPAVANLTLDENEFQYLVADYNNGIPQFTIEDDITQINCREKCVQNVLYRRGTTVDVLKIGDYSTDFMALYARKQAVTNWLEYGAGLAISANATPRAFDITSGLLYNGTQRYAIPALDSITDKFTYWRRDGVSGDWITTEDNEVITNTNWDSNGVLTATAATGGGRFYNHWVYTAVNDPSTLHVVMSQVEHANLASAQNEVIPSVLPVLAQKFSIGKLVGVLTVRQGTNTFVDIRTPFVETFTSATPVTHNDLAGLNTGDFQHLTVAEKVAALSSDLNSVLVTTNYTTLLTDDSINVANTALIGVSIEEDYPIGKRLLIRKVSDDDFIVDIDFASGTETFTRAALAILTLDKNGDFFKLEKVSNTRWEVIDCNVKLTTTNTSAVNAPNDFSNVDIISFNLTPGIWKIDALIRAAAPSTRPSAGVIGMVYGLRQDTENLFEIFSSMYLSAISLSIESSFAHVILSYTIEVEEQLTFTIYGKQAVINGSPTGQGDVIITAQTNGLQTTRIGMI